MGSLPASKSLPLFTWLLLQPAHRHTLFGLLAAVVARHGASSAKGPAARWGCGREKHSASPYNKGMAELPLWVLSCKTLFFVAELRRIPQVPELTRQRSIEAPSLTTSSAG